MARPASLLRRLLDPLRVALWTRRGRRRLDRGDLRGAVLALQTALAWRPSAFRALVLLGRAYLGLEDAYRAHRAFAQAREVDRRRFETEALPRLLGLGIDPARLLVRPAAPEPVPALPLRRDREEGGARATLPLGDCRDLEEYARFRAMPPIGAAEIEATDWDSVVADLQEE